MLKERMVDNVLLNLARAGFDSTQLDIVKAAVQEELIKVNVTEIGTEVMALGHEVDAINSRVIEMFNYDKAPKLSAATSEQYVRSVKQLLAAVDKSILEITTMEVEHFLRR